MAGAAAQEPLEPETSDSGMVPVRGLAVVVAAVLLTLVVTWPLVTCLDTCLGAGPDPLLSIYFLSWVAHALTTPGLGFWDAGIFAPYPGTLALGEYAPAYAPLSVPVILATGNPIVGHNVILLAQYTFAALGAALLARRLLGATAPALLAGVLFGYSPRFLSEAHNFQTLSMFWVPWLCLALERFLERPTWRAAGLAAGVGLALAGSSVTVFAYTGVAVAVLAAAAVTWGGRRLGRAHCLRLAGVGLPVAALLVAYSAPFRAVAREWALGRTLAEVEQYSAPLRLYAVLPPSHVLLRLLRVEGMTYLDYWALIPGITALGLAIVGLVAMARGRAGLRRALVPYVAMSAVAALLALGPTLVTPWGSWPLPYRALYELLPGFHAIRTPARFLAFAGLGLALLAAAGAARLVRELSPGRAQAVVAGLAVLALIEVLPQPFPGTLRRIGLPEVYRWVATEPPSTVVLELPMGEDWTKVAAAAFHLRRSVNGWASYDPPGYLALRTVMQAFPNERSIALVRGLEPDLVLVRRGWLDHARQATLAFLDPGFRLERVVDDYLVYRLGPGAPADVGQLEATSLLVPADRRRPWMACVTLRNPGPGWVPLYPLRRLTLLVESGSDGAPTASVRWLPLDFAPGASRQACVDLEGPPRALTVRGVVEGAGRIHRFVVTPGGPPARLLPGTG